jgi:hypothetical protein
MKKLLLVALGTIALMVGTTRIAKADSSLKFPQMVAQSQPAATKWVQPVVPKRDEIALNFAPPSPTVVRLRPLNQTPPLESEPSEAIALADLFEGGSDSLVAKAVGRAEGTRTTDGSRTRAYYGHVDPGNGQWNQGSFSYQHGARSPQEADEKQLRRLQTQAEVIRQQAGTNRLMLSLEAELNGIDLANQAPLAALDTGGYIDRLRQAYDRGFTGSDAVLQARVYSFINPKTNQWDAPGLGNNEASITHDQGRRLDAISQALAAHQQNHPPLAKRLKTSTIADSVANSKHRLSGRSSGEISKSLVSTSPTFN